MWAAQWWPVRRTRSFLTSGGLGTMGFSVPAAMGAALANPGVPTLVLTGDGSLLINIQELATIAENDLDIKICVFNNGHLGLVRQQQELFYGGRIVASRFDARPDFAAIARGFGIPGYTVSIPHDEETLGVPQRRAYCREAVRVLHLGDRRGYEVVRVSQVGQLTLWPLREPPQVTPLVAPSVDRQYG